MTFFWPTVSSTGKHPLVSVTPPAKADILTSFGRIPQSYPRPSAWWWASHLGQHRYPQALLKLGNRPCAQWCTRGLRCLFLTWLLKNNLFRLNGLWVLIWLLLYSLSSLVRPARLGSTGLAAASCACSSSTMSSLAWKIKGKTRALLKGTESGNKTLLSTIRIPIHMLIWMSQCPPLDYFSYLDSAS